LYDHIIRSSVVAKNEGLRPSLADAGGLVCIERTTGAVSNRKRSKCTIYLFVLPHFFID
jgi:hypothetical protein